MSRDARSAGLCSEQTHLTEKLMSLNNEIAMRSLHVLLPILLLHLPFSKERTAPRLSINKSTR